MKALLPVAALSAALSLTAIPNTAEAGTDPYIGDVMMVGFNFCPRGWVEANGALLSINTFSALFSLYGTTYGGDGRTTFGVPDLRGRVPVGYGSGPGLDPLVWGQKGGQEYVTLTQSQMPQHTHSAVSTATSSLNATSTVADQQTPENHMLAKLPAGRGYASAGSFDVSLEAGSVTTTVQTDVQPSGGGQPFYNMQPFVAIKFCVATTGVYPSRP